MNQQSLPQMQFSSIRREVSWHDKKFALSRI